MRINKSVVALLVCFSQYSSAWAFDLDALKADFLQGNYRRVIFEGQAELSRIRFGNADELNYIVGLSYIKEAKLDLAQDCFRRILDNSASKFKAEAGLALADTYLVSGKFQEAEAAYHKLISDSINSPQKPAVLYRLSQLESRRGNYQKSSEYLTKLKRDFPLSPELRGSKGIVVVGPSVGECEPALNSSAEGGEYSIQVGFFTSSANANNFKDTLLSKNYPAYLEDAGSGYRVKVGKVKSRQEALDLEDRLIRDGFQTKICPL
jgi:tetratricopeptide (TPR) repeat protein